MTAGSMWRVVVMTVRTRWRDAREERRTREEEKNEGDEISLCVLVSDDDDTRQQAK